MKIDFHLTVNGQKPKHKLAKILYFYRLPFGKRPYV